MKRYALVKDGLVENVIVWDGITEYKPTGYDVVKIPDGVMVEIGWLYSGGNFTPS